MIDKIHPICCAKIYYTLDVYLPTFDGLKIVFFVNSVFVKCDPTKTPVTVQIRATITTENTILIDCIWEVIAVAASK